MFPILYESITAGQVPSHNGLGVLSDCISCNVEQERNGIYELTMEYPMSGIHAQELTYRRIIKAKPNFTDNPQLFRIDRISKVLNGVFTVYAKHISYDLSGYEITSGTASSATLACALLQSNASGYTITTDKTASGNFSIYEPSSVRSWFGGKSGSFLDVFGTAEIKYNNFNIQFLLHAGQDRGVTIRYGKNLLELSQEITDTLYTHVLSYWKNEDVVVRGTKISTGLTLDVPKTLILDCSSDFEEQPTISQLDTKTTSYINSNNLTTPSNNITLDFVQSGELTNRVDLCDTVSIYYEALGITRTQVKCIRTVWDCLREKYIETEFGDAKTSLADTIIETNNAVADKPSKTFLAEAVDHATKLITGNLGGHIILHDSNGDGEPDELLVMDTDDISTAVNVWRWNQSGWGHSSNGYDGDYTLAATLDGGFVANFITTGSMSADRVRAGALISQNNLLIIDLDNGTITAPAITLHGQDVESTLDSLVQTSVETRYALSNSGTNIPSTFPLTSPTTPTEQQPYLWSRTIYTYANGQSSTSYGVSVRGNNGTNGQDGAGINIKGDYDTMAELIADHPTGSAGDAYLVGGDLVMWNTQTNSWEDKGRIQGPSGFDGLWLAIENDDDGTSTNVTYTVKLLKGVTDVTETYNAVFVWQLVKESGITEIATGTDTITVARDSADYGATIRCICIAIITEENLEDYSYTVIQDYSGNDIQIIGSNIVKLIGESEIYKPYAISSQFQVLSDEISARVTQTDFNSLSGTVTQQGTLIQQNAQQILLKADTSTVNTQMNGKMATNMSNRASSILIDSGQIRFDSNSLVVNSTKFTLDAQGNATFAGNITGASLLIGTEFVNIGDAIDDAEANAISASAIDATQKANNAQDSAINSAVGTSKTYTDGKYNDAKDYADGVASTAQTNAKNYTDGKITTVNQSLTVMSGQIASKVSQTDFNTLSNTVSTQGTAITQNAQAITLKASQTEVDDLSNTVSSQGTAINGKMARDMSNRASTITISSGEIAFTSNTLRIDATNLKVTRNGQVTASLFRAKDMLRVVDTSDVVLATMEAGRNGGVIAVGLSDTTQVGTMWANAEGGHLALGDSTGESKVSLFGNNGDITTVGKIIADSFGPIISSGAITSAGKVTGRSLDIKNSSDVVIASLYSSSNNGVLAVFNSSGTRTAYINGANGTIACGGLTAKTQLVINDPSDVYRIFFSADLGYGYAILRNANGDNNIYLHGDTGEIECVRVTPSSSRKLKENIKPIEDAEKILQLQAVSFDFKDKAKGTDQRGFIAEDVAEVLPNLVRKETEERPAGLDYIGMIPYLQEMIKRQQAEIDILKVEIEKLKGEK